jgi:(p)ppGpp synthase/HD superfamily hydrolase
VHRYAQTNLQLYAQLGAAGWPEQDLALVARGYELAISACGASFRPNGKPFVCHLVGTASIVASWEAPVEEVVCALLHSLYTHGVFAGEPAGLTAAKQEAVRDAVGEGCETLVAAYSTLDWGGDSTDEWTTTVDSASAHERVALRVRLANELEDHLDLGMSYARKTKTSDSSALVVLAEELVGPAFAQELADAVAANARAAVPDALVRADASSFVAGAPRAQR